MNEAKKINSQDKLGWRMWLIVILIGLAGQFAWSIENMYLNTFIAYLNFTAEPAEKFDYNLLIAVTTALSAITATLTTLLMGGLSDKYRKRKIFITVGYILWGISTASFGLLNVNNATGLLPISMSAMTAAIMVIVIDCIMTFFGSTGNDAAFNSFITKNISEKNRAKVEGVLGILPLIAMLIIFVGLNGLTTEASGYRWDLFFYIVGALVLLVGIISIFLIPKEKKEKKSDEPYYSLLLDGFKPSVIKKNKVLYLILITYFIFNVAVQIFFPYLMIYVERTCKIANTGDSFLTPFAIVMAVALLLGSVFSVFIGFRADKKGKTRMIIPTLIIMALGLIMMFFVPFIENEVLRIVYCSISGLVMILGYVSFPSLLNALVRTNIPKGKEGIFMGVRMIFVVALPMCIGPFIGSALNNTTGSIYTDEFGAQNSLPSNYGYLVALIFLLLTLIPLYFVFKYSKNEPKNHGTLVNDLLIKEGKKIEESEELPFNEYPRPNLIRDSFVNLNGEWKLTIYKANDNKEVSYEGKVIVPYPIESPHSKVNRLVEPDDIMVYEKDFNIENIDKNKRYILHFDGVDQIAEFFVNGQKLATSESPFIKTSIDISDYILNQNHIVVKAIDYTDTKYYSRGKQTLNPATCFYSSSSGIYKSVWLEEVSKDFIKDIKFYINYDKNEVGVLVKTNSEKVENCLVKINNETYEILTNKISSIKLINPISWSYKNPYLYSVNVKFKEDQVETYFGFRKIEVLEKNGVSAVFLNNKEVIFNGLLDQGYYYPDSLTPYSIKDFEKDILNVKSLGYNTLRKHIKVEMDYFYYLCDKHGLLIIQDIPNGGEKYHFWNIAFPRFNLKLLNKSKYLNESKVGRNKEESKEIYKFELKEIINSLNNYPSVVCYTLFNEGWGEFAPDEIYALAKSLDPTRIYDSTSGWYINNKRDLYSIHAYLLQTKERKDEKLNKPFILSECGGKGFKVKGHSLFKGFFAHTVSLSTKSLTRKYLKLYTKFLNLIEKGVLKGIIYTQLSDCESEYNGIYTFDREVLKIDENVIKEINQKIEKFND